MKFWVKNQEGLCLYSYKDDTDKHVCEYCMLTTRPTGLCNQNRFAYNMERNTQIFTFCYEKNIPNKQVKFFSKIACRGYEEALKIQKAVQDEFASFESITLHNVRKLTAAIGQKVDSVANEEEASKKEDKIAFYKENIELNLEQAATELLSIRKSINQIEFEYNAIDAYRNRSIGAIKDTFFTAHKAHTIVVMTFYMFEPDFNLKHILLNVTKFNGFVYVDFSMARSAISQILSNAVKYSKPQSSIDVVFSEDEQYISIKFEMESLYFTDEEAKLFTLKGKRGSNSNGIPGDGIGLFVAERMMQHNGGKLLISSNERTRYQSDGKWYSTNEFTLVFPKKQENPIINKQKH